MIPVETTEKSRLILASSGQVTSPDVPAGETSRHLAIAAAEALYGPMPPEAARFDPFETPDGLVRAEAIGLDDIDVWSLRYTQPDPSTPGRGRIVETTSLVEADKALFACRVTLFSTDANFVNLPSPPPALQDVCRHLTFRNHGIWLAPRPQVIGVDLDVTGFLDQLTRQDRWWNCIVIPEGENPWAVLLANAIQEAVLGAGNTFLLPDDQELEFAAAVGYDFHVEGSGVRVYRPRFDPFESEITAHPLIRHPEIHEDGNPHGAFLDFIRADCFRMSVDRPAVRYRAPSFTTVRQIASQKRSDEARAKGDDTGRLEALEKQIIVERRNVDEAVSLAIQSDEERLAAQAALEAEQALNYGLKHRIETLEASLKALGGQTEAVAPTTYKNVKSWVASSFSGKLRLTPRAEKGLRNAAYEKIEDVVAGLRLLAGPYRDMKRGECDPAVFEHECRALGFEETRSVSKISAGQHGDMYFVQYAGKRCFLDRHLKKGTSKDPRYCLRIYFFWDQQSEIVVVGSLPEHLLTSNK